MDIEKKKRIAGGTRSRPYFEEYGPYLCKECGVKVEKIKTKKCSCISATLGGGRVRGEWDETTYGCPKCKGEVTIDGYVHESDASYYSNEERRVYNL